jgi:NADH-quinone oxidoreductase subunit L
VVIDLKRIIAYSTMSQIGYMVVGVSIGAYVGGLFHLMTHAFFKALLFMAAGSVIAAMANVQNIDRMSGFRRALPLTSALLIVGALALAAFPGTSGFFSKDEILAFASDRGGMYLIFTVGGYIGAFMTAIYAFRIGFRVVRGDPCEEARELERGHLHHAEPRNPATGELEDTDVGFPGPEHQIAERRRPMAIAMAVLGVIGGLISIAGIAVAHYCYVANPGVTGRLIARLPRLHRFLENKWYFDELQDALVYRPAIALGRFANSVFERVVVDGIVNGATGAARGASLIVRGAQSGFVRAYALLLVGGFAALGVYFLVAAS